jgi:hypothetical protein
MGLVENAIELPITFCTAGTNNAQNCFTLINLHSAVINK